jgi:heterodisulfide reductase subunit C/nitrate reductase gamma subunit
MSHTADAYGAILIFTIGITYKISTWFRHSIGSEARQVPAATRIAAAVRGIFATLFSAKILVLAKVLIIDVFLQGRILRRDFLSWVTHLCIFGAFLALLLMHALGKYTMASLFRDYYPTLNPYLFLRDLFGVLVILAVAIALSRRSRLGRHHAGRNSSDRYALGILAIIILSGSLLQALKISSPSAFDEMVQTYTVQADADEILALEAYWVKELGLVSPRIQDPIDSDVLAQGKSAHELQCMQCHSSLQWAFGSHTLSSWALGPLIPSMGAQSARSALWILHFYACLIGLAYLPFCKMFHMLASPLSLLANAVMDRDTSDQVNIATRQIMELDACTHCGACSERCLMAPALEMIPNLNILPSEKIVQLKALVAGKALGLSQVRAIQEGLHLCTHCGRCTEVCPVGINLAELWVNMKEALLEEAVPELLLLTPFSLRRGLTRDALAEALYQRPLELARETVYGEGIPELLKDTTTALAPGGDQWLARFGGSLLTRRSTECYGCMVCSNSCPVVRNYPNPSQVLGLLPHQIMHAVGLKLWDIIFSSPMLWNCLGCYQCQEECPERVCVADILCELKNLAMARAHERLSRDGEDTS